MNAFDTYLQNILDIYIDCEDLVCRRGGKSGARFAVVFLRGINSRDFVAETVIRPLVKNDISAFDGSFGDLLECHYLLPAEDEKTVAEAIAKGDMLIAVESNNGFFKTLSNAQSSPGRSVDEPGRDVTMRGPKAGFVENI